MYYDKTFYVYILLINIIGKIVNKLSNFKRNVPFTQEEDDLIKKRVLEWGDKGSGLWVNLQKELCRPSSNIIYRWNSKLNKCNQTFKVSKWTEEEVGYYLLNPSIITTTTHSPIPT